ncbi:MAG: hypothetical protein WA154_14330, partial [Moraxellaceae bacterium]
FRAKLAIHGSNNCTQASLQKLPICLTDQHYTVGGLVFFMAVNCGEMVIVLMLCYSMCCAFVMIHAIMKSICGSWSCQCLS